MGFNCAHGQYMGSGCHSCETEVKQMNSSQAFGRKCGIRESIKTIKTLLDEDSRSPYPLPRRDVLEEVIKKLEVLLD